MANRYREREEELLDQHDSFLARTINELARIEEEFPPFTSHDRAFECIHDEIKELENDINRAESFRVIRHQLHQVAARCWRYEKDLLDN